MRDSAVFYRSFYEAIKELDAVVQAQVYSAIFEYALNFQEIELTGIAKTVFTLIKPQLDANNKRYANGLQPKQKQNGSKSEAKVKQEKSKVEANDNVNDNVNENKNDNVNDNANANISRSRFRAPTYDEIFTFMKEKNGIAGNVWSDSKVVIESKAFFNHYESNGWMVGKNKMKKWEAAVSNWMNNNFKFETSNKSKNIIQDERAKKHTELEEFRKQYRSQLARDFGTENFTDVGAD